MSLRSERGFTLVELMLSVVITIIVFGLVLLTVRAQQQSFADGQRLRAAQGSARSAIQFMEQELQLAGYGMDAPLAFDFDRYQGPCPASMGTCARDRTDSADEIVFYHRNPLYWVPNDFAQDPRGNAWRITALNATGNTVTINARAGDRIRKGQVLQAVCKTGVQYAYFTVATTAASASGGALAISLVASAASDPFLQQNKATDACFTTGEARLFLIDRVRFHVRPVQDGSRWYPYLVLDRGVDVNGDNRVDENDELVLADGIEALQFGYFMTNAQMSMRGGVPGTLITMAGGWPGGTSNTSQTLTTLVFPGTVQAGQSVYTPTSFYSYSVGPPPPPSRSTDHQANIRAVRIVVRARSAEPDVTRLSDPLVPVLNQSTLPAWVDAAAGRYGRSTLTTTVALRNMTLRGMPDY